MTDRACISADEKASPDGLVTAVEESPDKIEI